MSRTEYLFCFLIRGWKLLLCQRPVYGLDRTTHWFCRCVSPECMNDVHNVCRRLAGSTLAQPGTSAVGSMASGNSCKLGVRLGEHSKSNCADNNFSRAVRYRCTMCVTATYRWSCSCVSELNQLSASVVGKTSNRSIICERKWTVQRRPVKFFAYAAVYSKRNFVELRSNGSWDVWGECFAEIEYRQCCFRRLERPISELTCWKQFLLLSLSV